MILLPSTAPLSQTEAATMSDDPMDGTDEEAVVVSKPARPKKVKGDLRKGRLLSPTISMDLPYFPLELEREILEISAETWSCEVPNLLLVAHRVHVWLEPFLYRSIRLGFPGHPGQETDAQEAFLSMASSKPPSFLARAVRRVSIDFPLNPELGLRFIEALQHCTGITYLMMNRSNISDIAKIFKILDLTHLSHVCIFLGDLMPPATPMDAHQPIFCTLTHLSVFDVDLDADPRLMPFLMILPALTHLALNEDTPPSIWSPLLQGHACRHLRILVIPFRMDGAPAPQGYKQWANDTGRLIRDPRVVFTVYDLWTDYSSAPVQGPRYWQEAQMFIEKKRLGLIPDDHYWIEDCHTTEDSPLSSAQSSY
ncbi:hypothetical protein C8F01DRAFT_1370405 [Mycena amicta]|nr:hypothetical protein C8F01DRAFT_1370405 [Mycena amicta]